MGCGTSTPSRRDALELQAKPRRHQATVSAPSGGPVLVPPTYRELNGMPVQHASFELDSDTIQMALHDMAAFLEERSVRVKLVTVGGAVNTLYLRSRQSTHDVDFFMEKATSSKHHVVHEAARFANRRRRGQLGAEWLNNSTQLFMPAHLQSQLYNAALEQGTLVFERAGLKVLCEKEPRPYDLADAAVYLREYLRTSGRQSVSVSRIREWCKDFNKKVTDEVLQQLDEAYYESYGDRVIDWTM
ncbi:hypothetical protein E4U41_005085 [Claviceps citrina]|nr:hypothetical protein E4U41_005085 [Claviceps citrina]